MSNDQLKECPDSPNCVSTQTQQEGKKMDPIPFELDPKEVTKIIKDVVENFPRTELLSESSHYLHYTFKSKIFGFTDDVEFAHRSREKTHPFPVRLAYRIQRYGGQQKENGRTNRRDQAGHEKQECFFVTVVNK